MFEVMGPRFRGDDERFKALSMPVSAPCLTRERACGGIVAGVDEAGRGPLAGPVVAAAVVLDPDCYPDGLNDSKVLTAARREALLTMLRDCAEIGVGIASVEEIETLNIHWATMLAMERAVAALPRNPGHVLVDGNRQPRWGHATTTVIGGDALSLSIAAASIVAKVTRDRVMTGLAAHHPGYGWATNMGYATREHCDGLARLGATIHHRAGFAPVAAAMQTAPLAVARQSAAS
jgi:ribonuclease HII